MFCLCLKVLYVPASQDCWEYVTHSDAKESAPSSCSRMSDDHSTLCETVTTVTATPAAECPEDVFRPAAEIEKRKSEPTGTKSVMVVCKNNLLILLVLVCLMFSMVITKRQVYLLNFWIKDLQILSLLQHTLREINATKLLKRCMVPY